MINVCFGVVVVCVEYSGGIFEFLNFPIVEYSTTTTTTSYFNHVANKHAKLKTTKTKKIFKEKKIRVISIFVVVFFRY